MKEKNLSKLMGLAVNDYGMIEPGDRVLAGLSGGADSIALVSLLYFRLQRIPIEYDIVPLFIDIFNGESPEREKQIQAFIQFIREKTGLETQILRLPVYDYLRTKSKNLCFKCAQIRRSELIKYADANGFNKIALGHHKDDIVETILMNLFIKRELSAMMPRLPLFDGKMEIIRPLAYLEKRQIIRYIEDIHAELLPEACPAKLMKKELNREMIREMLPGLQKRFPNVKNNIFAALRNAQPDYLLDRFFDPTSSAPYKRP